MRKNDYRITVIADDRENKNQVIKFLSDLIVYASRQIKSTGMGVFQRRGYQPKGKRKQQLFILQGLPGIGSERAIRLLDTLGSVEAVVTATSEELQSVKGIGDSIAARIKWAVKEKIRSHSLLDEL
jgi:ERCC4-type nuclease